MSKKKKHTHQEEEGGEAWLLPYSDLMTLLLAVFIVLFAVSQVDAAKAQAISQEFSEQMMTESFVASEAARKDKAQQESGASNPAQEQLEKALEQKEQQNLKELKSEIDSKIQSESLSDSISTSIDKRGLVISLNNAVLFESGSAEIKNDNENALMEVANMINTLNNYIRIEGHTDNIPMHSEMYPSNWQLSTARAVSVVELFINKCNFSPKKLVAVGYGEYRPVADNSTEEGRTKNRRIDIIVLSEKYNDLEKQITN